MTFYYRWENRHSKVNWVTQGYPVNHKQGQDLKLKVVNLQYLVLSFSGANCFVFFSPKFYLMIVGLQLLYFNSLLKTITCNIYNSTWKLRNVDTFWWIFLWSLKWKTFCDMSLHSCTLRGISSFYVLNRLLVLPTLNSTVAGHHTGYSTRINVHSWCVLSYSMVILMENATST